MCAELTSRLLLNYRCLAYYQQDAVNLWYLHDFHTPHCTRLAVFHSHPVPSLLAIHLIPSCQTLTADDHLLHNPGDVPTAQGRFRESFRWCSTCCSWPCQHAGHQTLGVGMLALAESHGNRGSVPSSTLAPTNSGPSLGSRCPLTHALPACRLLEQQHSWEASHA